MIDISSYPIYAIIFWIVISILSLVLFSWLFFAFYNGYRYEIFKIIGFIFLILSISLPEILPYNSSELYLQIGVVIAIISFCLIFLGIITSHKTWVKKKGTTNLNKFGNLLIYSILRQPIILGFLVLDLALIFYIPDVVVTIFLVMSFLSFILASYEKDNYMIKIYGYPYRVYMKRVPKFNIFLGIIRAVMTKEEEQLL